MKKIKQVALCMSILTLVGCGGTPSYDKKQSTSGASEQSGNSLKKLMDQRKLLLDKLNAESSEIQKLKKDLDSEQNIDKKLQLVKQLEVKISQANTYIDDINLLDDKIDELDGDAKSTTVSAPKPSSSTSKSPQTREEYIDAILEIAWKKFGDIDGVDKATFRQTAINEMQGMTLFDLKQAYAEGKAEMGGSGSLSSGAVRLSHRNVRLGKGGFGTSNFSLNGQAMNQSIDFTSPMVVQLKGNLDTTGKSSDAVGSVAYNLNGWVAGVVHGYANTVNQLKTHESAVMMSTSFKGFFVEGQVSAISGVNKYDQSISGTRYLVTLGYDHAAVSPFIQYQHLSVDAVEKKHGLYVGLDTDVLSIHTSDATFTSKVLAKVGYETGFNTNISAYVEWTGGLKLSDGVEISNTLNIGSNDQIVKLNVSFEQ